MKKKYPILYIIVVVFLLIPSILSIEGLIQLALNEIYPYSNEVLETINPILFLLVSVIPAFGLIAIYRKYIDKKSFFDMGFSLKNRGFDIVLGLSLGIILISTGFIIQVITGNLEIDSLQFKPVYFFTSLVLMLIVSLHEEVLVRGYLLNSLMGVSNKYVALLISSVLFASLHLFNTGITTLSFINIVLAGFLLGASYIHNKNLWFPMALHFSWNFFQGPILGYEVSGNKTISIITQNISGSDIITGGKFGFEGSIIATVILLIAIFAINWFFSKKEALKQKITIGFHENKLFIEEDNH